MKQLGVTSADQGARKLRVVSPRDTRHASHTPHTGNALARIDRVHNRNSRATTGSTTRRELRNRKTPADRYEYKVKSHNNKATLALRSGLGGGDGGLSGRTVAQTERLYSGALHSQAASHHLERCFALTE